MAPIIDVTNQGKARTIELIRLSKPLDVMGANRAQCKQSKIKKNPQHLNEPAMRALKLIKQGLKRRSASLNREHSTLVGDPTSSKQVGGIRLIFDEQQTGPRVSPEVAGVLGKITHIDKKSPFSISDERGIARERCVTFRGRKLDRFEAFMKR